MVSGGANDGMIQTIVMTSDRPPDPLRGFLHLWQKYYVAHGSVSVICGFTKPDYPLPDEFRFVSMGRQEDFPPTHWSERLTTVLDEIADDVFLLMLDDYWLTRPVDGEAIRMAYGYMRQFTNVVKFDLTDERLYAKGGNQYLWGYNTYDTLGYLDLIKSDPESEYHMSLWCGLWRRDLLRRFIIPGETAQQIEIVGTTRLRAADDVMVLGTRQCPLRHINAIQGRAWNPHDRSGIPAMRTQDRKEIEALGYEFGQAAAVASD